MSFSFSFSRDKKEMGHMQHYEATIIIIMTSLFGSMVTVAFQSVFHVEMYQNDIFLFF
jgi:hypothetical protein